MNQNKLEKKLEEIAWEYCKDVGEWAQGDFDEFTTQIKATILKELKKNKPGYYVSVHLDYIHIFYNQALEDFEAVLDKVLGGKE